MPGRHDHELAKFTDISQVRVVMTTPNGDIISDVVPSMVITEVDHWLIHMGVSYLHSSPHTVGATGGTLDQIFQTGATAVHLGHMHITSTQGDGRLELFKNVTSDNMGTAEVFQNKNFGSANVSSCTIGHTPLNPVTPTAAVETWLVTGGKHSGGEQTGGHDEYVLETNTKYMLRFTNNAGQADPIVLDIGVLEVGQL